MKNMTFLTAAILFSTIFSGALAHADATTTYQTLLNAYNTATQPAGYSDFGNQPVSTLNCALVMASAPTVVETTNVGTEQYTVTPATPAYGPLIPANPGVTTPLVILMGNPTPDQVSQDDLAVFSDQITPTDFVITVAQNSLGIYSDVGDSVRILFRKNGAMLPFIMTNESQTVAAGYCY